MIDIINENEKMTECLEWYWFHDDADYTLNYLRANLRSGLRSGKPWRNVEMIDNFVFKGQVELMRIATKAWNEFDRLQRTIKEGREE